MTDSASRAPIKEPPHVIIRPWPKVVFLYPVFICATIFWMLSLFGGTGDSDAPVGYPRFHWMGDFFPVLLFLNLMVFSFDFSRIKSITILFGLIATAFALFWANENWEVISGLRTGLDKIDVQMNTWFYGLFSAMVGLILLLVLINTRFNYYEVNHREILHHHGYLGDVTRLPTAGLRLNKEIYDLMEFLLLRSGRLIFYPSTSREAIVIDNVLNVNYVEDRIKNLLSVVAVRMSENPTIDSTD
jgi:hypothetical protein